MAMISRIMRLRRHRPFRCLALNHKYIHHGFPGDLAQGKKHRRPLILMYYRAVIESRVLGNGIVARASQRNDRGVTNIE